MAKAQQKSKATSTDKRNSERRNGKAFKKEKAPKKYSGRTILGYRRELVIERAKTWDPRGFELFPEETLRRYVDMRKAARKVSRQEAAAQRANERRTAANSVSTGRPGSARVNGGN